MAEALIYVRLSHDHRDAADTLERQETDARARAAVEGLTVRKVYNEGAGRSAFGARGRARRPAFAAMLDAIQPGDVVIARGVDRLARDAEHGLEALRLVRERGGYVLTLWDGIDTLRDKSSLNPGVRMLLAEEESAEKARRIRSKQADNRARGRWTTGSPPWGLAVVVDREQPPGRRGSYIVEPGAADTGQLRPCPRWGTLARELALSASERSSAAIARDMNAAGVPTTYGAERWSGQAVRAWLRSPALAGLQTYRGRPFRHPETGELVTAGRGILTVAEWESILTAYQSRTTIDTKGRRRGRGPEGGGLLSGLAMCGGCGKPLALNRRGDKLPALYRCSSRTNVVAECPGCAIAAKPFEEWVKGEVLAELGWLLKTIDRGLEDDGADPDPVAVALVNELAERWSTTVAPEVGHRRIELEAELAGIGAAIDRLAEAFYVHQDIAEPTYRTLRARQEERRAVITAELAGLPTTRPDIGPLRALATAVDVDRDDLRKLLAVLVERIDVKKAGRYKPPVGERVSIRWTMTGVLEAGREA